MPRRASQNGSHAVGVSIILAALVIITLIGIRVLNGNQKATKNKATATPAQSQTSTSSDKPVRWAYNEQQNEYFAQSGVAPACKQPFRFDYTPVDLAQINVIGMPGSYRGYNYKPHGGLRADSSGGNVQITMPADATLVGLKRYYEGTPQTLQYLLTFESDCGIAFRFDHLRTLTPALQKIAETTPEPTADTRSDPNRPFARTPFKAGDLLATTVGFPATKNYGFDFGVYDYRHRNEISKNPQWAAIHTQYRALEWFGACWLDMLPEQDTARAKQLALTVLNPAKPNIISDYCSIAPHKTLDFNNGQPTDG